MDKNDENSTDKKNQRQKKRSRPVTRSELLGIYKHIAGPQGLNRRKPHSSPRFNVKRMARCTQFHDVLIPAFFHYFARYTRGCKPADEFEGSVFQHLSRASPEVLGFAGKLFDAYRNIDMKSRSLLFDERYLVMDESRPIPSSKLKLHFKEELERLGLRMVRDQYQGIWADWRIEPGAVRYPTGPSKLEDPDSPEIRYPPHPWICSVNDLRGADHVPALTLSEYSSNELAWDAQVENSHSASPSGITIRASFQPKRSFSYKVFGKEFRQPWQGEMIGDTCLRIPETTTGGEVFVKGFNFYDRQMNVRIWMTDSPGKQWVLPAFVIGEVSDTSRPPGPCSKSDDFQPHDLLIFRVPRNFEIGNYTFRVEVANSIGYTWPTNGSRPETFQSNEKYLNVSHSGTRYRIRITTVHCEEETPGCGSDEVLIYSSGFADVKYGDSTVEFDDVDSGDSYETNLVLFDGEVSNWLSFGLLGLEVDDADYARDYQKSWSDLYGKLFEDFNSGFWEHLHDECSPYMESVAGAIISVGCYIVGGIAGILVNLGIALFTWPWAIWAPADLLMEDTVVLDKAALNYLIDPWNPLPMPNEFTTKQGVAVSVQPLGKLQDAYLEKRTYECSGGRYSLTYRYERLSPDISSEVMAEALFGRMV